MLEPVHGFYELVHEKGPIMHGCAGEHDADSRDELVVLFHIVRLLIRRSSHEKDDNLLRPIGHSAAIEDGKVDRRQAALYQRVDHVNQRRHVARVYVLVVLSIKLVVIRGISSHHRSLLLPTLLFSETSPRPRSDPIDTWPPAWSECVVRELANFTAKLTS